MQLRDATPSFFAFGTQNSPLNAECWILEPQPEPPWMKLAYLGLFCMDPVAFVPFRV